jgi:urocanate hydratase
MFELALNGGSPTGQTLSCLGWEQEGVLRCLLNNLDPAVAEDSEALVVYGGKGKAARDPEALRAIVDTLCRLKSDETMVVQSGRAVLVVKSHVNAPRVLISTSMVVPAWSTDENFWAYERAGLTMYGQMTAAGWFYIGTQGILGFTYETFSAVSKKHFQGEMQGRRVLTAGLGGMGGAQGRGITYNGASALIVEVDERRARRRLEDGWIDHLTYDYAEALAILDRAKEPTSVALIGNIADIAPRLVADGVQFDVATDQTSAHDLVHGYIPIGYSAEEAEQVAPGDLAYAEAVRSSLVAHVNALLELERRGTVLFEYGNNLRAQAVVAGVNEASRISGFVPMYIRPIFSRGVGPFRWICLSGDPEDLRRTEEAALKVAGTPSMAQWFERSRADVVIQGLPARICWLGLGERNAVAAAMNDLVRAGLIGPVAIGRDHQDTASVSAPSRETEGMLDGSDAIADWPVLSALLNAAQGATWVAIGNGGGVGIGQSIHSGMVVVADGTELAAQKIDRVFWSDPALGVARYVDAGYGDAKEVAKRMGLDLANSVSVLSPRSE